MEIAGLQKLTLIDYPGKLACTVFLPGCNFRCPWCFSELNYLLTDQGKLKIKDIVENETNCKVYDSEGKFSSINKYFQRRTKKMLQIKTFSNSEIIECTPSHKFLIYDSRRKKIIEKEAQKLNKKYDFLTISIPQKEITNYKLDINPAITSLYQELKTRPRIDDEELFNKVIELREKDYSWRKIYRTLNLTDHVRRVVTKKEYLDSKILPTIKIKKGKVAIKGSKFYINKSISLTPRLMRLIGYYLAEGCVSKKKNRKNSYYISFAFNSKEKKFINDTKKIFLETFGTELIEKKDKRYNTLELICYKSLLGLFFKYYFGSGCYNKKLPWNFIFLNKHFQKELIKGLFRGDGITSGESIKKYQTQKITLTSGILRDQISLILYRLGIKHSRFRKEITISDKKIFDILEQSYLITKKKINTAKRFGFIDNRYAYLKIRWIKEKKRFTKVYNLEMSNDSHTYNVSLINVANCYSRELVLPQEIKKQPKISEEEFFNFLEKRKGFLEGVVLCGGEPTVQPDLFSFARKIKDLGFLVKLDTNGSHPGIIKEMVKKGLLDYVAMDVKLPKGRYSEIFFGKVKVKDIEESIQFLKEGKIDYEFRTTVVPTVHTKEDLLNIVHWIRPAKKYVLQNFRAEKTIDLAFEKIKPYSPEFLLEIQKAISPFFEICQVR